MQGARCSAAPWSAARTTVAHPVKGPGGKGHWCCAFQVAFTVSVTHRFGSQYILTTGIVQSFARKRDSTAFFVSHTHPNGWIFFTSGCPVSLFPNRVKDFISHLQAPRPKLGSGQSILFQAKLLPQQCLQIQTLLRSERQLWRAQSLWVWQHPAVPARGSFLE